MSIELEAALNESLMNAALVPLSLIAIFACMFGNIRAALNKEIVIKYKRGDILSLFKLLKIEIAIFFASGFAVLTILILVLVFTEETLK